jgi:hypothetical protein
MVWRDGVPREEDLEEKHRIAIEEIIIGKKQLDEWDVPPRAASPMSEMQGCQIAEAKLGVELHLSKNLARPVGRPDWLWPLHDQSVCVFQIMKRS